MTLEQQILLRQSKMEERRRYFEDGTWKDIGRFISPRRRDITIDSSSNSKGQNLGNDIYDGSPQGALNTWSDGMQGFLVSGRWFKSEMSNPQLNRIDSVRHWLQMYDEKMYSAFDRGNFYAVIPQWFRDAGSIGTATLFSQDNIGEGRISHTAIHPREVFIAENQFGEVDTVHRKFMLTARQAIQKFDGNVSKVIKDIMKTDPEKQFEFIHAVFPNDDRIPGMIDSSNKKFRSIYMESKTGDKSSHINRDSGFDINPYAVWRFRKNSDEVYGRSPGSDALTEVLGLNQMGKTLMEAGHLAVKPAMNIPIEMRGQTRLGPDGRNYYSEKGKVITPINNGGQYPIGLDQQERLQKMMEDKYRVEFFKAFIGRTGEATAAEIFAIKGEQAGLMIAQVDMLYIEGLRKIFDIVSYIEDERGAFTEEAGMPPIPDEIADSGGRINFLLTGPLAQAQRRIREMQPIEETMGIISQTAAVLGPEMLDWVNKDETAQDILELGNLKQKNINTQDQVDEIRAQRQAALEQQQAQQAMIEGAGAIPNLNQAVEPGSPLEALSGAI